MRRDALIEAGYRYWLGRDWGSIAFGDYVLWVMLNPSTADAEKDDPTIRKCIGFTRRFGYQRLVVVNLFAFRATDPRELADQELLAGDIVGPRNDEFITELGLRAAVIVCAWGAFEGVDVAARARAVDPLLPRYSDRVPCCLGYSKAGAPRHPLMMPYYAATQLKPWPARRA